MATHLDDEDELEKVKTWWKENWLALAAGLVVGFGAIGGWEFYKGWRYERAVSASSLYEQMQTHLQAEALDQASATLSRLEADYSGTPYAVAGLMLMASAQVEAGELEAAAGSLERASTLGGDEALSRLAQVRRARVLSALERHDEALKLVSGEGGPYASLFAEVRGDIEQLRGNPEAALVAYDKALSLAEPGARNRELLQRKRDDLNEAAS